MHTQTHTYTHIPHTHPTYTHTQTYYYQYQYIKHTLLSRKDTLYNLLTLLLHCYYYLLLFIDVLL